MRFGLAKIVQRYIPILKEKQQTRPYYMQGALSVTLLTPLVLTPVVWVRCYCPQFVVEETLRLSDRIVNI